MSNHTLAAGAWLALTLGGGGYLMFQQLKTEQHESVGKSKAAVESALKETALAGQRGEIEVAQGLARAATEKYPEYAAVWVNLGVAYRAGGKVKPAIDAVKKAMALDPSDWDAVAEHATLLKISGDEEAALKELERVPAGRGRARDRLSADPAWSKSAQAERLDKLKTKHGAKLGDTGMRHFEEMERRRQEYRQANKLNPTVD